MRLVYFAIFSLLTHSISYAETSILNQAGLKDRVIKIEDSPLTGLKSVLLKGGKVIYLSTDGNYIFEGKIIGTSPEGLINLTEPLESTARAAELEALPPEYFITYKSPQMRSYITVFTDVGCPFCQKFHKNVKELTEKGVGVRYLPYPRGGVDSEDYTHLLSVWCAKDPISAADRAMQNKRIPEISCNTNVVKQTYELGQAMALVGTPSIVLPNGTLITGYRDTTTVLKALGLTD